MTDAVENRQLRPLPLLSPSPDFDIIGYSRKGRPLVAHFCGDAQGATRILVLAGQHGDEFDAPKAALEFLRAMRCGAARSNTSLAIVADANPDGAAAGTRLNANGADLNRDHLVLSEPETRAVHAFVTGWKPDLVIDIHTYRPRKKELLQHNLIFPQEVMVDFPTNPAARLGMPPGQPAKLLRYLKSRLAETGVRCDRYTLVRPSGMVRHSSTDILDARNGLTLRYGVLSVLMEGRRPSPEDLPRFAPVQLALVQALKLLVAWAAVHLRRYAPARFTCNSVPVVCRHVGCGSPLCMEMLSAPGGDIRSIPIPGNYMPRVRTTLRIKPPNAYGVPRSLGKILTVLERHSFIPLRLPPARWRTSAYRILRAASAPSGDAHTVRPVCSAEVSRFEPEEFAVFPTDQPGGHALTVLLEPESKFGLHRFPELGLMLTSGTLYPIVSLQ